MRLRLAHLPTPLVACEALSEELGIDLWIKRDDATGGPEAGNKIRKLEFLLADARAKGCDTLLTCGGMQSNHARTTAIVAARLGMKAVLRLRDSALADDDEGRGVPLEAAPVGNVLLERMAGAEVRRITGDSYGRREELLAELADRLRAEGRKPYVIPEGGSNGLGALGYVAAMAEIRQQLEEASMPPFDVIVHACGSGGTAAGTVLGAAKHDVAGLVVPMAVCDDAASFTTRILGIAEEAHQLDPSLKGQVALRVDDRAKGPAYAVSTPEQRALMVHVARKSGLILDPVYSGKAFQGLLAGVEAGEIGGRVLFIHTGGLPGLLAQAESYRDLA